METQRDAKALSVVLLLLHSCVSHSDEPHPSVQLEKSSQTSDGFTTTIIICLSICLSVYLCVCLSVCLSVYLSIYLDK